MFSVDTQNLLNTILIICITAIPIIVKYGTDFVRVYAKSRTSEIKDQKLKEHLNSAIDLISDGVNYTSQTYVDLLKSKGTFDAIAQKQAFEETKKLVLNMMSRETRVELTKVYGDLDKWLTVKIESEVKLQKSFSPQLLSERSE